MAKIDSNRTLISYLIVLWMMSNLVLMLLMLTEDYMDLNNWIELGLWTLSIAGVVIQVMSIMLPVMIIEAIAGSYIGYKIYRRVEKLV
jgi:hypothetical protein